MNFAAQDDTRVTATVLHAYNFESDNEDNINTDDLSDLSDVFEEEHDEPVLSGSRGNLDESAISLDDITYDRDLKYINVPNGGRSKPVILQNNRLLKQVRTITNGASAELNELDQHYTDMDNRKRDHDKKFLVEFDTDHSGKAKDNRPKRSTRGRGRRGAGERPEGSGRSRMEEDNVTETSNGRGYDVDIVEHEVKSSRRRNLVGQGPSQGQSQRGGRGEDSREPRGPKGNKAEPRARNESKSANRQGDARLPRGGDRAVRYNGQEQHQEQLHPWEHELTEPHTVRGADQHLEREYADYIQAAPSAYSPYVEPSTTRLPAGRGQEGVHPRAVPYLHPHSANAPHSAHVPRSAHTLPQKQEFHPEPRYSASRDAHRRQLRDAHPAHYQPYANEAAYGYEGYDAPADRYSGAPQHGYDYQYEQQAPRARNQHQQPTYPPQRLYVPDQYYPPGQGRGQGQGHRNHERNPQPPQPPSLEPKLNAKAAEFVPTWTTG